MVKLKSRIVSIQSIYREMLESAENFAQTTLPKRKLTALKTRLIIIENLYKDAKTYHQELVTCDDDELRAEYGKTSHFNDVKELYIDFSSQLKDEIDALNTVNPENKVVAKSTVEFQLPRLNVPVFSGTYEAWKSFKSMIDAFYTQYPSMSKIQKLTILKDKCEGDAANLIKHLSIEENGFDSAMEILMARYENQRVLVNIQLNSLLNFNKLTTESADSLKKFLDNTNSAYYALKNLDVPIESWSAILIFLLTQKLPPKTQQLWEEKQGTSRNLSTFGNFKNFIEARFRALEGVQQSSSSNSFFKKTITTPNEFKHKKSFHLTKNVDKSNCKICRGGKHPIRQCERFLKLNIRQRIDAIKAIQACINCLSHSHTVSQCQSDKNCYHCKKRHNSLLHIANNNNIDNNNNIRSPQSNYSPQGFNNQVSNHAHQNHAYQHNTTHNAEFTPSTSTCLNTLLTNHVSNSHHVQTVLLATALVRVISPSGTPITLRTLLDPGSEASFITESAAQLLQLTKHKTFVNITGLGQNKTGNSQHYVNLTISSLININFKLTMDAIVLPKLTTRLPSESIRIQNWKHLQDLQLADPLYNVPGHIDLLLGSDVFPSIIQMGLKKGLPHEPIAQQTELGWIISGQVTTPVKTITTLHNKIDLDQELRRFWEIEDISTIRKLTVDEEECQEHFATTHYRLSDGKYVVSLPFKQGIRPTFQNSYRPALVRLLQLEKKFKINSNLKTNYTSCISEYATLGHMSPTSRTTQYFLPHHAVYKESSTSTKLRVVFDASCKDAMGKSLNDHLMIGPRLQDDITDIIMRWRKYKYVFTADIEKMYRQIWIAPEDVPYQIILWRNEDDDVQHNGLQTVTFGTAAAPYLAIRTLHQLAADEEEDYPIAANIIRKNFYVDDVLHGTDTINEAVECQRQLLAVLRSAGFPLRKWSSNCTQILNNIPEEDREVSSTLALDSKESIKTLGIHWHPGKDTFHFKVNLSQSTSMTKREVLSDIAKLFDPLGWISPAIILAKLLMQELWLKKLDWDEMLSTELKNYWLKLRTSLCKINIEIPRWIHLHENSENLEIHGFSDASERAYSAVVYLRMQDSTGAIHVHLISSKTKVAPLKTITLARLELCGAVMLSKLIHHIKHAMELNNCSITAWSDSMIVLAWIRANPSRWTCFVANRVAEIQKFTNPSCWNYVPSKLNPADLGSRGLFPEEIANNMLWWHGPGFLQNTAPFVPLTPEHFETTLEERKINNLLATTAIQEPNLLITLTEKYSSFGKLIRVVTFLFRFINSCKQKTSPHITNHTNKNTITNTSTSFSIPIIELKLSLIKIIFAVQNNTFQQDIQCLMNNTDLPKASKLRTLYPFLDEHGLLRVGGRLQNSSLNYNRQHPIIIPSSGNFTKILIRNAHLSTLHGGIQSTSAFLRTSYWILRSKSTIKFIINKCITCYRHRASVRQQLMGNLPKARIEISRPFTHTGVDYAGPIEIKAWKGRCNRMIKGYISVFVCLCTKAIHLELVSELSTAAFLAAFRRFSARRGICSHMYSDCGTNFVGANNYMLDELKKINKHAEKEIIDQLSICGTQWHFNPPAASHHGGLWEAGVKSVKYHLKRVIGNSRLTFEEFMTMLCQVEACLNSRPLCPITDNPDDLDVLTPGHFLIGEPLNTPPELNILNTPINHIDRWKYLQRLYQDFWHQWSFEYLSRLQTRPKWLTPKRNVEIGNLVLLKDERQPPTHWALARIITLHPGKDGLVRVVTIKTKNATLKRPISKICLLPSEETHHTTPHLPLKQQIQ